jgi:hypothetical protein
MAHHHDHPGHLLPQETSFDNADTPGLAQPYSQSEIDDLVFGSDRSVAQRLERLREIRAEMLDRDNAELGDDADFLIEELDLAIARLAREVDGPNPASVAGGATDLDPSSHLDTLAPDDMEAREALIGEDAFYEDDEDGPADDDHAWHGSEEFRHDLQ